MKEMTKSENRQKVESFVEKHVVMDYDLTILHALLYVGNCLEECSEKLGAIARK